MTNAETETRAEGGGVGPTSAREQARAEIRRELDRLGAHDQAREALAVMAESYLRFLRSEGPGGYRIVDDEEKPRSQESDARAFTVADLVAELRDKHPGLFRRQGSNAAADGAANGAETTEPTGITPPPRREPPARDWLQLAPPAPDETPVPSGQVEAVQPVVVSAAPAIPESAAPPLVAALARAPAVEVGQPWKERFGELYGNARVQVTQARAAAADGTRPLRGAVLRAARRFEPWHLVAAAAFVVGVVGVLVLGRLFTGAEPPAGTAQTEAPPSPETTAASPPPPPAATEARELRGTPEVIDTATLRLEGKLVHLFGVEWDRGGARDDLASYLKGRSVVCTPAGAADRYRCRVDGRDVSEVVLYNGGGRATPDAPPELVAAEGHARAEKVGIWNK